MKLKRVLVSIYIFILILSAVSLIVFSILGKKERVGYLSDILLNIEETLNNNSIHTNRLNINDIEEYILTNDMITNYVYNFRISYYSKVFRNSDIYGVYLNTNSLPDYVKNIRFDEIGSPFGILVGSKIIKDKKIDDIEYSLKIKYHIFIIIIISIYLCFILFCNFSFIIFDFIKLIYNIKSLKKINLKNKYVYILIMFLSFLIMPNIIYAVFGKYFDKTNYENRLKSKKPVFNISNLDKYPKEYEKYFNDYIPFRNELVQLKNIIDFSIFDNVISTRTILGKNKWMFYKEVNNIMKDYIGVYNFSDKELEEAKNNLLHFRDELKKRNIDFIFMICPDKQFIYSNYMPDYVKRKTTVTSTDKFVKYIRKNTDIKIVYPKDELIKYKDKYQLYYKYDYHWNYLGAYIAYTEFMKTLSLNYINIDNSNIILTNKLDFYKDLTGTVNLSRFLKKDIEKIYTVGGYNNYNIIEGENLYNKYVLLTPKLNTNVINSKLFIIRDSFSQAMFEYFSSSFIQTSFINLDKYNNDKLIKDKPNIVLFETVDRLLKARLFYAIPNYKIEEINKDLETNFTEVNN